MPIRTKMDPNQILKTVFDEELEAYRMVLLPTELAIELSADDGDSVLTQKKIEVIEVEAGQIIDTSKASRMSVTVTAEILMVIDEDEIALGILGAGQVKEICSPAIKIMQACKVILQS